MLQSRNVYGVLACIVAVGCASAPPAKREPPADPPATVQVARDVPPEPEAPAPEPSPPATPAVEPDSPIVVRVSYGNLGTAAGSEWAVHADGQVRGKVCDEPRALQITAEQVAGLRSDIERCKLCKLPERDPSGANADKQIYRVEVRWPDLSCTRDVSMQSRFHYDKRAQRCHDVIEALLHARVTTCPGDELEP
jgi:hypothetical protein